MNEITKRARRLRKDQTDAEKLLWDKLRYNQLGEKFRRQYPIIFSIRNNKYFIIADFFCKKKKLVIEVDGKIHENQREYDEARASLIKEMGYRIIRFTNEQIYSNISEVVSKIISEISVD